MKSSILFLLTFLFLPTLAFAGSSQGFTPLVGIPGLSGDRDFTLNDYVNALYGLAISVAALIAVIKIVLAGAKYMMDDIVTHKSEAKADIKNALIGLLIIIGAVIILNTINSNLTTVDINAPSVGIDNGVEEGTGYIETVEDMAEEAQDRNTELVVDRCDGDLINPLGYVSSWFTDCPTQCKALGGVMSYEGLNRCTYLRDAADNCQPQSSDLCCEYIKGGTWDDSSESCSGLEEASAERERMCYSRKKTWDEKNDTCRNNRCDPNTSSDCCEMGYGGELEGGKCVSGVSDEQACEATDGVWDDASQSCNTQTITNETQCESRQGSYYWDSEEQYCYEANFLPVPPYIADQCEGETDAVSCLKQGCLMEGYSYYDAGPPAQCVSRNI